MQQPCYLASQGRCTRVSCFHDIRQTSLRSLCRGDIGRYTAGACRIGSQRKDPAFLCCRDSTKCHQRDQRMGWACPRYRSRSEHSFSINAGPKPGRRSISRCSTCARRWRAVVSELSLRNHRFSWTTLSAARASQAARSANPARGRSAPASLSGTALTLTACDLTDVIALR